MIWEACKRDGFEQVGLSFRKYGFCEPQIVKVNNIIIIMMMMVMTIIIITGWLTTEGKICQQHPFYMYNNFLIASGFNEPKNYNGKN